MDWDLELTLVRKWVLVLVQVQALGKDLGHNILSNHPISQVGKALLLPIREVKQLTDPVKHLQGSEAKALVLEE